MEQLDKHFRQMDEYEQRSGDVPTKDALNEDYDNYYETFVREVLQNSNDAGLRNSDPVQVRFNFEYIEKVDEFAEALDLERLKEHYEAITGEDHSLRVEEYLEQVREENRILVLTVEDRNTVGLRGEEDDDKSEYTALVRDWRRTYKETDSAGGSHGVGKSVLWASSALSTVLFSSNPKGEDDYWPRLVGRVLLPDHRVNGEMKSGIGWLGKDEKDSRPVSVWGEEAKELASNLYLDRPEDVPGTSALILGFSNPAGDLNPDVGEVIEAFREATVKYFWPAIHNGDLEVHIRGPGQDESDEESITSNNVKDKVSRIAPFVDCFERRGEAVREIEKPGDVVRGGLKVEVEKKEGDKNISGNVDVLARVRRQKDDDELLNHVALFRGAGMVVDYVDRGDAATHGHEFFSVLVCGEARSWGTKEDPSDMDREVDELLKAAEPPAHDEWCSTPTLSQKYKQKKGMGPVDNVTSLQGAALRDELIELIGTEDEGEGGFILSIASELPRIGGNFGGSETEKEEVVQGNLRVQKDLEFDGMRWEFEGEFEPDVEDHGEWSAEMELRKLGEDGKKTGELDVAHVESGTSEVDCDTKTVSRSGRRFKIAEIEAGSEVDSVEFEGHSIEVDVDPLSGQLGETSLYADGEIEEKKGED